MIANGQPTVLIVDDDETYLATLSRSLQSRGLQVCSALTPIQALAELDNNAFDLVLLDLNLGGESGLNLLRDILAKQPAARVVMLTAYASIATTVEAIKLGADNYLCKPIKPSEIIALLEPEAGDSDDAAIDNSPLSVSRLEWEHMQRVLLENDGNISATARALGMHRRTLQRKLQKNLPSNN